MTLRQFQCLLEIVRCGLSISKAAHAMGATQPAISKQIRALEAEIGVALFEQRGNRLVALSPAGVQVHQAAEAAVREAENIRRIAADFSTRRAQTLSVASTYTHARYVLVRPIKDFVGRHPEVRLRLQQGSPDRICQLVAEGTADLGILTLPQKKWPELVAVPCLQTRHSLVMPIHHPLAGRRSLTLDALARYPMIAHDVSHQIGSEMKRRFDKAGLQPDVVLQAQDSDVMKAYVEAGIGIAIIPKIAFSPLRDKNLRSRDVSHLFDATTTCVILRRGSYPPAHVLEFVQLLAPGVTRRNLDARFRNIDAA